MSVGMLIPERGGRRKLFHVGACPLFNGGTLKNLTIQQQQQQQQKPKKKLLVHFNLISV